MSKSANAGELRTNCYFTEVKRNSDSEGYPQNVYTNVFGEGIAVKCKWVNAHGAEVVTALQMELREPATLTLRYSPKIHSKLVVFRESDIKPYEIISVDDVEDRHVWLELKVQRMEGAR